MYIHQKNNMPLIFRVELLVSGILGSLYLHDIDG